MNYPSFKDAVIPVEKLTNYLLSLDHPIGRWKAKFFRSIGFNETNVDTLREALRRIAQDGKVKEAVSSSFGKKYVIEGSVMAPNGGVTVLCTVWILGSGEDRPRFVTAYPA
jgi:hypothetical protein